MIHVDSLNEELKIFTAASEIGLKTAFEPEPGLFIAESPKVILRALDAGYEPIRFLCDEDETGAEAEELLRRIEKTGCPMYSAKESVLDAITGFKLTRGALCAMRRRRLPDIREILAGAHVVAVLDNVENPSNVGAIMRSAAALGIDAVIVTEGSSDPLYRRALRVSMGTAFVIPWTITKIRHGNIAADMREYGFKTVAFALRGDSVDIRDDILKKEERLAIILGNEGDGLTAETIDSCDHVVKIPMREGVDSLNVAAASAIAFWELGFSRTSENLTPNS